MVDFGATAAASFTVVSPTEITAVSPAGSPGAVDVKVTGPDGRSAVSSADQFTYSATLGTGAAVFAVEPEWVD